MYNYIFYIIPIIVLINEIDANDSLEKCIEIPDDLNLNHNNSLIFEIIRKDDSVRDFLHFKIIINSFNFILTFKDIVTKSNEFILKAAQFNKNYLNEEYELKIDEVFLSCLYQIKNESNSIQLHVEFKNFTSSNENLSLNEYNFSLFLLESILINQLRIEKSINVNILCLKRS